MKNKSFLSFFVFLVLWQVLTMVFDVNKTLFPSPIRVFLSLFESKQIFIDMSVSLARLIAGALIGILAGILFGLITGEFAFANETFGQLANFFRFIPPLALVPLFIVWFGIGESPKVLLLAFTAFFPVWISTFNGVQNIEEKYRLVAKSLNIRKLFLIKEIIMKGSLPYILNGARLGISFAFSVLVAAEMLGAYFGIGYRLSFLQSVYKIDLMIGYIIILGIIGLVIDRFFLSISKKLTPWKNEN
ncbi:MAG TPA: ABC transporter permease [Candidatus Nanoarchaeia archaeon]|nr:ABC transporter permease [Candidatus Nanoarchaeia archaeon]